MQYKVLPLFYSASENFKNTIGFSLDFKDPIDPDALRYAADQTQKRYPYFSVRVAKQGETFVLETNETPFVITEGDVPVCLNSEESNFHLLAFNYYGNTISVNVSHFICDGNGIAPLFKTLAYYYIEQRYPGAEIDTASINLVSDPVRKEEYVYPIPAEPLPEEEGFPAVPQKESEPFVLDDGFFHGESSYAYLLRIKQNDLMKFAKGNDGSPVSFISVMIYKALMNLYPQNEKDIIIEIPHQYRGALGNPYAHDCLARVAFAKLPAAYKDKDTENLNTMVRGQIVVGCDIAADIQAVNGMLQLDAYLGTLPLEAKKQTLQGIVASSLSPHTCGVSYTGRIDWGGMERYIEDGHAYAGENRRDNSISVEIFVIGEYFSIVIMQKGENPALVKEMIRLMEQEGVTCELTNERTYQLSDYLIP